ncbi:cilia- and flagella-associated protein 77 [Gouania willdenowi]|uniref:Cilia- and flagella-associated protein 77 n=1 Tax=Gouania willdenowi TaxID=441366 RepID=A0A8C5EMX9_GOUWI|nr:cilia- and flagella-associated protein 77 [Gouania willdenowi]XP_028313875.1 cilia- and flagella-associated protein 77 [Gouania willdenowi]
MSSPRIGVVRKSMLSNPRIMIPPPGRSRMVPGLPGPDFTYGITSKCRDGGVAEVLTSWKVSEGRQHRTKKVQPLDFVALNRNAVRSGLTTSKELSQHRAQKVNEHGAPHWSAGRPKRREASRSPLPDITYGVKSSKNSESIPLWDLLSYEYSHRWKEEQLSRNFSPQTDKGRTGRAAETRTSLLRRRSPSLPVEQKRFTLSQFKQVPAALDTFRNPEDRPRRLSTQQLSSKERHGRDGDIQAFPQDSVTFTSDLHVSVL